MATRTNVSFKISAALCSLVAGLALALAPTPSNALATLEVDYSVDNGTFFGQTYPAPVVRGEGGTAGIGAFQADGDIFLIKDTSQDGYRIAIHWKLADDSRRGLCVNKTGTNGGNQRCNKDLPESKSLMIRLGVCTGGSDSACNEVSEFSNFGAWATTSTS